MSTRLVGEQRAGQLRIRNIDEEGQLGYIGFVLTSTISETKNHLSELLERVQNGETLVILDRKKPVARVERVSQISSSPHLIPPRTAGASTGALALPIGGRKGASSGVLAALLDERKLGL